MAGNGPGRIAAQYAFQLAGATVDRLHVNRLREAPHLFDDYQVLCIPGGFSYGDDVAAGKISTTSPIGRCLLNKKVGDSAQVVSPNGNRELEILKLTTVHDLAEAEAEPQ